MNLLSSIWSGIKSAGSTIKNSLSSVGNYLSHQTAAAIGSFMGPLSPTQQLYNPQPTKSPLEIYKVKSTPQGDVAYGQNVDKAIDFSGGNAGKTYYGVSGGQNTDFNTMLSGGIRPSTYAQPTDQSGRTSSTSQGSPYYDTTGKYVVPSQGFFGLSGEGGGGTTIASPNGTQGNPGGGGSSFTGLLGGVGSASSPTGTTTDEQKKKDAKGNTQVLTPQISPQTASAVSAITSPFNSSQFAPPSVPDVIDAGYISKMSESINKLASSGSSLSADDRQQVINSLTQNLLTAKAKLDQQLPTDTAKNMVSDTQEQLYFINNTQDPFGVKSAMDTFRAQNTTLGNLMSTRIELMKNVQALNEAYKPIMLDIKQNPDLPKALSRRRLEDLAKTQKETLQGFLDQLTITEQQISDQNQVVNRQFNIVTLDQTQANRAQDDLRANLSLMISSGAIAGFTDGELGSYAHALTVPVASLKKARDAALDSKKDIITNEFPDGSLRGIDKTTGKEVWRLNGAATPTVSTSEEAGGIESQLKASTKKGAEADGTYADPNLYASLRQRAKMSASEFDNRFGYLVNPDSRGKLGVGGAAALSVTPVGSLSQEQTNLLNQAKATIDAAKQRYQYTPALREQIIQKGKLLMPNFDLGTYI